jgi:hypothetical protein
MKVATLPFDGPASQRIAIRIELLRIFNVPNMYDKHEPRPICLVVELFNVVYTDLQRIQIHCLLLVTTQILGGRRLGRLEIPTCIVTQRVFILIVIARIVFDLVVRQRVGIWMRTEAGVHTIDNVLEVFN